jgi:hypothetical protein
LKLLQEQDAINFMELKKYFGIFNDQVLKKALKEIDVEVDRNQDCYLIHGEAIEDKIKNLITHENVSFQLN